MSAPAHPQVPVAKAAHDQMHVVAPAPLKNTPAMNYAVVGYIVSGKQPGIVERTAPDIGVAVSAGSANAISHLSSGVILQCADQSRESRICPLIVVELISAKLPASH